jgi:D-cysteine desulfhydrase family pyridoxal phosphate-dependent enzyme
LPTPLHELQNLSNEFAPFNLFVKRDDQTGLALGGNKARKLDFIMADVLCQKADCIVTWAGVQSNWCRQLAAAATTLGIRTVLILFKGPTSPEGCDGNLLLDRMFDAEIRVVDAGNIENMLELESVRHVVEPVVDELRSKGLTPYLAPIGGSLVEGSMRGPWGALGYVDAFAEIVEQTDQVGVHIDSIVLASGSGGTQAGLLVGAKMLSPDTRIVGITVYASKPKMTEYVRSTAAQTVEQLGDSTRIGDEDIIVFDDYLQEGYGVFNGDVGEAIRLFARSEGLLLDPVYTGKAATGLLDLMQRGYFDDNENILFLHTGGTPALFPYRTKILEHLS